MTDKSHDSAPSSISILLIEDNEHDRRAFERAVHKSEKAFRVSVCEKAEKALDKLSAGKIAYDLAIFATPLRNALNKSPSGTTHRR